MGQDDHTRGRDQEEGPAVFLSGGGAMLIDRAIEAETLANVRFGAHNGLKSDIAACLAALARFSEPV